MGTKKIKGQYLNRSAFQAIKYMYGSVFFKAQVYECGRFGNTGSHTRTTFTHKLLPRAKKDLYFSCFSLKTYFMGTS